MSSSVGLYLNDPYARSFEARVLEVAKDHVVLDRTAFCPGEIGQNSDRGWLRWGAKALNVDHVDARSGMFWHYVNTDTQRPKVGQTITGELDWTYRHRMMRTHTAFHLVSAIAFHLCGAHASHPHVLSNGLRLQFKTDCWNEDVGQDLQRRIDQVIAADLPVYTYSLSREEALESVVLNRLKVELLPKHIHQIRVVEIEGVALDVDLGTHIRSTSEIGSLELAGVKPIDRIRHQVDFRLSTRPSLKTVWPTLIFQPEKPPVPGKAPSKPNQFVM